MKTDENLYIIYIENETRSDSRTYVLYVRIDPKRKDTEKMTKREFLNAIVANEITEDAIAFAQSEIEKLDKTNEQRRLKNAEKASATAPLVDKLVGYLTGTAQTATDLMEKFAADGVARPDDKAWTPQYVSRLARLAVEEGRAEATEVKPTGGKGKQKAYLAI